MNFLPIYNVNKKLAFQLQNMGNDWQRNVYFLNQPVFPPIVSEYETDYEEPTITAFKLYKLNKSDLYRGLITIDFEYSLNTGNLAIQQYENELIYRFYLNNVINMLNYEQEHIYQLFIELSNGKKYHSELLCNRSELYYESEEFKQHFNELVLGACSVNVDLIDLNNSKQLNEFTCHYHGIEDINTLINSPNYSCLKDEAVEFLARCFIQSLEDVYDFDKKEAWAITLTISGLLT